MKETYQISLSYACFGIDVVGTRVMDAAPIGRWMIGKHIDQVKLWVRDKGGIMKVVPCSS